MNEEDKITINSLKFYDIDELEVIFQTILTKC